MTPGFIVADLGQPCDCTSWAPHRGGAARASRVVWCGVVSADLPIGVAPDDVLRRRLEVAGLLDSVAMMTSRDLSRVHRAEASETDARGERVSASVVVTAGYGNALRVGDPARHESPVGTINILAFVDRPLSEAARLEALSLVVEARTLAAMEASIPSIVSGEYATGTGTDCVVVASALAEPGDEAPAIYAGKHTAVGAAIGRAALSACREATTTWVKDQVK